MSIVDADSDSDDMYDSVDIDEMYDSVDIYELVQDLSIGDKATLSVGCFYISLKSIDWTNDSSNDGYSTQCLSAREDLDLSTPPDMVVFYSLTEDDNGFGGTCFGEMYFNFQNTDPLTCYSLIDKYDDCFEISPPRIRDIFDDSSTIYEGNPQITVTFNRKPMLIKSAAKQ